MAELEELISFYENHGQEDVRLRKDGLHYLEFITASRYLDKHLPPTGRVLDSCAGTGVYSFYLAERGRQVSSGDIVPYNIEIIKNKQKQNPVLQEIFCADALDLSRFASHCFQAVLCMGAFYHLVEDWQRRQVLAESMRLLKRHGVFVCTYMNRHAVIMQNIKGGIDNIDEVLEFTEQGRQGIFYASTPEEITRCMADAGLRQLCHVALDGISVFLHQISKRIDDAGLRRFYQYHLACCEQPSLLGYSYHNMFIGQVT